jgi:hypothetical protein
MSGLGPSAAIVLLLGAGPLQPDPRQQKQDEILRQIGKAHGENRVDDGLKLCEEFFRGGFDRLERGYEVQRSVVELLARANRLEDALRASRILLDATPHPRGLNDSVRRIMGLFKQLDGDVGRCNAFLEYQVNGPAGADGRPGTADDPKNPLEAYAYPDVAERARGLEESCARAGDDAEGSRVRAYACLLSARPKEALRHFVEACRRGRIDSYAVSARELVWLGVRPLRGHAVGLGRDFAFVTHGPADDLKDPVAALLEGGPAAPAGRPADRVAALKELHAELKALVEDRREPREERRWTVAAILRIHEALNDWARPEVKGWLLEQMALEKEGWMQAEFMRGALIALRGGDWHLGGLNPALGALEQEHAARGRPFSAETQNLRHSHFKHVAEQVWKEVPVLNLKPEPPPREKKPKK